jgi:hypothetical protein
LPFAHMDNCHLGIEMRPYLPHEKSHPKVAFLNRRKHQLPE